MEVEQPKIARRDFIGLAALVAGAGSARSALAAAPASRVVDMDAVALSHAV